MRTDPESFLLILSQDKETFKVLLKDVSQNNYKIISVPHVEVKKYLAACNYGLLFREKHIVNWVSRPTKALEYQAAKLEIIHNKTVNYISDIQSPS